MGMVRHDSIVLAEIFHNNTRSTAVNAIENRSSHAVRLRLSTAQLGTAGAAAQTIFSCLLS